MLLLLLLLGCGNRNAKTSGIWSLTERYPSTYYTIAHVYHYATDTATFFLSEMPGKKDAGLPPHTKETVELDGVVYALCEPNKKGESDQRRSYYESLTESRRLVLNTEEESTSVTSMLTLNEAAALMRSPTKTPAGVTLQSDEWDLYFRMDSCNLEIYVYPNDNGKHASALNDTYESQEENGETYLYSSREQAILYTDGTNSIMIRQANRAGSEHVAYCTLSECKAILALLG